MERDITTLRTLVEELVNKPAVDHVALFLAGVEASKVSSMQTTQPVYLNAEAREAVRRVAEANGLTDVNKALRDPNTARFINDPDCARDE